IQLHLVLPGARDLAAGRGRVQLRHPRRRAGTAVAVAARGGLTGRRPGGAIHLTAASAGTPQTGPQRGNPMNTTTRLMLLACLSLPVLAACQDEGAAEQEQETGIGRPTCRDRTQIP